MNPDQQAQLEAALKAGRNSLYIREIIKGWLRQGQDRDALHQELMELSLKLREMGREDAEDVILDALDYLVCWCHPDLKL